MNSAEVLIKFKGDNKDLSDKTSRSEGLLKGFAGGVSKAFKVAATGITTATVAVGALVKQSVDAYAEFEQLEGGIVSLFGEGSKEMQRITKASENAYKDLTMSQNQYLTAFESAYPLVNAGLSENADGIEYTNKMLQISSDLFNTYGGSVEQYQNAINWALKGSFVYLDNLNLGIKGTQEGFVEAANASGILGREIKNVNELTSDEIIDVIQHYSEEYGVWGKTAQEAGTTILGSLNMVKSSWTNFLTGLSKDGSDVNKLIDELVQSAMIFGRNLMPVIMRVLESIVQTLPTIINKVVNILPELIQKLLPPLIQGAVALVNGLIQALPTLIQTLLPSLIEGLISIAEQIIILLPDIIIMIADMLPTLIPRIVEAIMTLIPLLIQHIPDFLAAGGRLLAGLVEGIVASIPRILVAGAKIIASIIGIFTRLPGTMLNIGLNVLKGIGKGMLSGFDWLKGQIKKLVGNVTNFIKKMFGIHSPSKVMANQVGQWLPKGIAVGIDANADSVYDSMKDIQKQINSTFGLNPSIQSAGLHYSPNVIVNTNVNVESDPLGQTVRNIKTFSGGAKNDYNYGMGV